MLQVSMSLESNPSILYTNISIYKGIDAIIKTSKIGKASAKIKVDISLLDWFILRSHAARNICFKDKFWSVSRGIYG